MTKITNKGALEYVLEKCEITAEVREKLEKMVVALEKKAGANRKPTKAQEANENLKAEILSVMENDHLYTVTEIQKSLFGEYSNQKVSALIRQLIAESAIVRTEEKGKAFFSKVSA